MDYDKQWNSIDTDMYARGPFLPSMSSMTEKYPPNPVYLRQDQYDQEIEKPSEWPGLDLSGNNLIKISPSIGNFKHLKSLYLLKNNLSSLPKQLFTNLTNLTLLDISHNKLEILPQEIENLQNLKQLLFNNNFIKVLPPELGRLWKLDVLSFDENPIISPDSSIIQKGKQNIISYLRDCAPLIPPLPEREWVNNLIDEQSGPYKYKIFSYNILAESYATEEQHPYTPTNILNWDNRKHKILERIIQSEADIICLQEVEGYPFKDFFVPKLREKGYEGIHKLKTRSKTMSDPNIVDGCAIFYKTSKFKKEDQIEIEYQTIAIQKIPTGPGLDRTIRRDNIGLILILQIKPASSSSSKGKHNNYHQYPHRLLICNTHIHWDPSEADVKLIQAQFMLEQLEKVCKEKNDLNMPLIITGDFNSEPSNAVFDLMSAGNVSINHKDWNNIKDYGDYSVNGCSHSFKLNHCFDGICKPDFSNFNGYFMGILDYIWYSYNSIRILGVSKPPTKEQILSQKSPLPNSNYPSDHIYLLTEIEILKKKNK